jgi:hypothetical protein
METAFVPDGSVFGGGSSGGGFRLGGSASGVEPDPGPGEVVPTLDTANDPFNRLLQAAQEVDRASGGPFTFGSPVSGGVSPALQSDGGTGGRAAEGAVVAESGLDAVASSLGLWETTKTGHPLCGGTTVRNCIRPGSEERDPLTGAPLTAGELVLGDEVGPKIVGEGIVGPALPGTAGYAACVERGECGDPAADTPRERHVAAMEVLAEENRPAPGEPASQLYRRALRGQDPYFYQREIPEARPRSERGR